LLCSTIFHNAKNLCVNQATEDWFNGFQPSSAKDFGEIMPRGWVTEMQDNMQDFDPNLDFLLGVMLYGDKMGTDIPVQPIKAVDVYSHNAPLGSMGESIIVEAPWLPSLTGLLSLPTTR
jgi:hypothetical protein